jgi:hypothetical protein
MFYGSTSEGTGWSQKELNDWKVKLLYRILFFIPRANQDNEKLYSQVKLWLLEVNDDGTPNREVALNKNKEPIFSAPNERNYGLWTDSSNILSPESLDPIESSYFEEMWDQTKKLSVD